MKYKFLKISTNKIVKQSSKAKHGYHWRADYAP